MSSKRKGVRFLSIDWSGVNSHHPSRCASKSPTSFHLDRVVALHTACQNKKVQFFRAETLTARASRISFAS